MIKYSFLALTVALFATASVANAQSVFSTFFTDKTMRVDYVHTGGGQELFSLDQVVSDGPWAGSRTRLLDDTNLGPYFFEVIDRRTNQAIYSRGFASLYGEWETTAEPKQGVHRSFHESLRFPWPKRPVQVVLKKRGADGAFHEIWATRVDPSSRFVNAADAPPAGNVWTLLESGPPNEKVDLVILGEGYTAAEIPKFHADARRLVDRLFATDPLDRKSVV
jgi:hypothetical protein